MKGDDKFSLMYSLDEQNRKDFLMAVEKRIADLSPTIVNSGKERQPDPPIEVIAIEEPVLSKPVRFVEMLAPMEGHPEATLQFIVDKVAAAGFDFNIFHPVTRLPNGKNPYGLNGCMAAMIDFFYQNQYFKKKYSLEDIFKAYLEYTGNTVGKLHTFLSNFRKEKSYLKHFTKLKALRINPLS
jgi:hypothetical protein